MALFCTFDSINFYTHYNMESNHTNASSSKSEIDLKEHWDRAYSKNTIEKLGWYETDLSPSLNLITSIGLAKSARILNIGAGSTTLIDELLEMGFTNLIATDISTVALKDLENRTGGSDYLECITDDITHSVKIKEIEKVDLWIDRAVLHFFVEEHEKKAYFDLLKSKIKDHSFVIFAEFNLERAVKCSGLPVCRYDKNLLQSQLGSDFKLIKSFDYHYTMPSGDKRPYVYTLFQKRN